MSNSPKISSFTLIVAFLCVALAGIAFIPMLPVKLSPSKTLPSLSVSFSMYGNSARVIEMEVTSKLESMLTRIKGVKKISSMSGNGWGRVSLELDKHTNIDAARFEASAIVRQTWSQLPDGVSYPSIYTSGSDDNSNRPFMVYTLNAAATPIFIQRFAEEKIKTRLSQIPGIYRIDVSGATPMEWRLEYNSKQLTDLGITTSHIQTAIYQHYQKEFLGTANITLPDGSEEWIRLALVSGKEEGKFKPEEIELTDRQGKTIRLDQLLKVVHTEKKPNSYYRINGLNSIYLSITADVMANQLDLCTKVKETMDDVSQTLPDGYEMHTSYDATEYMNKELNKIYVRSGLTILILLLFVLLITRSPKYLFLIVVSLSINLAIAVIFYYLLGLEIQLYSLAGITISLSLIIDNTIVMTDHIRHRHNRKAFLSILAATLTTIGALCIIFFLDERIRLNLQDFAAVVIINLAVSLFIALFLVPALIDKLNLEKKQKGMSFIPSGVKKTFVKLHLPQISSRRLTVYFGRYYRAQIRFLIRWRVIAYILVVLAFGLPVFLLPEKMEGEGKTAQLYNKVVTSDIYKEKIKPILEKGLGGSLRVFAEKVYNGNYSTRNDEVVLSANATLPNGSTMEQMNILIQRMEAYLSEFKEIKQFQTGIYSSRRANISIYFTNESKRSGFPYTLKSKIIGKALELGGGSWFVSGLEDQAFNNDVREMAGSYRIKMFGYNYDELYAQAEKLTDTLYTNRRIKSIVINSEFSSYKEDYQEFYFDMNKARMAQENILPYQLFQSVRPVFGKDIHCGNIMVDNEQEELRLSSRQSQEFDIWNMQNVPQLVNGKPYKLSELATVEKGLIPQNVAKENQQYRLCLQYEYVGASNQGYKVQKRTVDDFNKTLPVGYSVEVESSRWGGWGQKDYKQYLLLALIVTIIFFTTSILFNSLKQPGSIIFVIPISYIGVFLTFYFFKLNFDQGGFTSFVLLCGITVNASIYILNEFNQIRLRKPMMPPLQAYLKAWNAKIIPIFLTVISTILGFIPFMVGEKESFWFPLAAGTIGGLIMSIVGIFFYFPLFVIKRKDVIPPKNKRPKAPRSKRWGWFRKKNRHQNEESIAM